MNIHYRVSSAKKSAQGRSRKCIRRRFLTTDEVMWDKRSALTIAAWHCMAHPTHFSAATGHKATRDVPTYCLLFATTKVPHCGGAEIVSDASFRARSLPTGFSLINLYRPSSITCSTVYKAPVPVVSCAPFSNPFAHLIEVSQSTLVPTVGTWRPLRHLRIGAF